MTISRRSEHANIRSFVDGLGEQVRSTHRHYSNAVPLPPKPGHREVDAGGHRCFADPAFPLVPSLGPTGSASGRPALFVGFAATLPEADGGHFA